MGPRGLCTSSGLRAVAPRGRTPRTCGQPDKSTETLYGAWTERGGKSIDQVLDKQTPSHAHAAVLRSSSWDGGGRDEMAGGQNECGPRRLLLGSQWSWCWWRSGEATTRLGVLDKALVVRSAPQRRLWVSSGSAFSSSSPKARVAGSVRVGEAARVEESVALKQRAREGGFADARGFYMPPNAIPSLPRPAVLTAAKAMAASWQDQKGKGRQSTCDIKPGKSSSTNRSQQGRLAAEQVTIYEQGQARHSPVAQ
ncbi:hypothetical protein MY11210_004600 [Beauveria gryllotalpidicola]